MFDFAIPPPGIDDYNADFRQAISLSDDDWLILQPTRVIPRKGIELAADLIACPSLYEGFGNALIETIYFRKPERLLTQILPPTE